MVTRASVESVLDRVRPFLVADGGDIELVELRGNSAVVKLGECQCPSAHMTLHLGVETALREAMPEFGNLRVAWRNLRHAPHSPDIANEPLVVGRSAKMRAVFEFVSVIARSDSTVLITGESGTGEGSRGQADSSDESAQTSSVRRGQLCAVLRDPDRVGALRPRTGRVHRGHQGSPWTVRNG